MSFLAFRVSPASILPTETARADYADDTSPSGHSDGLGWRNSPPRLRNQPLLTDHHTWGTVTWTPWGGPECHICVKVES